MKNTFYIIALSLILTACGGSSSSSSDNKPVDKDLFSLWKPNDGNLPLDLTEAGFREDAFFSTYLPNGAQCDCNFVLIGDQESGSYTINSCTHLAGTGSGTEAPNCNALDHTGLYTKTSTQLTVCDDVQECIVYN